MRLIIITLSAVALLTLTGCSDDFKDACEASGGVVDEKTDTNVGTGVSASGQVVVVTTSNTTRFCLVDGKITDVD